jgi:hypothetical protein
LFPHLPSGLLCLVCGLALPQSQKAREIFFCVAERLDIEIGLFGLGQPVAKTSLAVSTSFEGTKAIESAGWPGCFSVKR